MSETPKHDTVLDIGAEQLGATYAKALIAAADSAGAADEVLQQLRDIVQDAIGQNPQLAAALESPRVDREDKIRIIDRLFGDSHPVLLRFLKVVAGRDRLGYIPAIQTAAEEMRDDMLGRVRAEVITATPLADDTRGEVQHRLQVALSKEVTLIETVDPAVIGGMVIRIGDTVYDNSVAGKISNISRKAKDGFASYLMNHADSMIGESAS